MLAGKTTAVYWVPREMRISGNPRVGVKIPIYHYDSDWKLPGLRYGKSRIAVNQSL